MKNPSTTPIFPRVIKTYGKILQDLTTSIIAALIVALFVGPYGMLKTYNDYINLPKKAFSEQLRREMEIKYDNDMGYYITVTIINIVCCLAALLLVLKFF